MSVNNDINSLKEITAQNNSDIINALSAFFSKQTADSDSIKMRIDLGSSVFEGILVKLQKNSSNSFLTLFDDNSGFVHFIPSDSIKAFSFLKNKAFLSAFGSKWFYPNVNQEASTKLLVNKYVQQNWKAQFENITLEINWGVEISENPDLISHIGYFCMQILNCFLQIKKDQIGSEALSKIKKIAVNYGQTETLHCTRLDEQISITHNLKTTDNFLTELENKLSKVL